MFEKTTIYKQKESTQIRENVFNPQEVTYQTESQPFPHQYIERNRSQQLVPSNSMNPSQYKTNNSHVSGVHQKISQEGVFQGAHLPNCPYFASGSRFQQRGQTQQMTSGVIKTHTNFVSREKFENLDFKEGMNGESELIGEVCFQGLTEIPRELIHYTSTLNKVTYKKSNFLEQKQRCNCQGFHGHQDSLYRQIKNVKVFRRSVDLFHERETQVRMPQGQGIKSHSQIMTRKFTENPNQVHLTTLKQRSSQNFNVDYNNRPHQGNDQNALEIKQGFENKQDHSQQWSENHQAHFMNEQHLQQFHSVRFITKEQYDLLIEENKAQKRLKEIDQARNKQKHIPLDLQGKNVEEQNPLRENRSVKYLSMKNPRWSQNVKKTNIVNQHDQFQSRSNKRKSQVVPLRREESEQQVKDSHPNSQFLKNQFQDFKKSRKFRYSEFTAKKSQAEVPEKNSKEEKSREKSNKNLKICNQGVYLNLIPQKHQSELYNQHSIASSEKPYPQTKKKITSKEGATPQENRSIGEVEELNSENLRRIAELQLQNQRLMEMRQNHDNLSAISLYELLHKNDKTSPEHLKSNNFIQREIFIVLGEDGQVIEKFYFEENSQGNRVKVTVKNNMETSTPKKKEKATHQTTEAKNNLQKNIDEVEASRQASDINLKKNQNSMPIQNEPPSYQISEVLTENKITVPEKDTVEDFGRSKSTRQENQTILSNQLNSQNPLDPLNKEILDIQRQKVRLEELISQSQVLVNQMHINNKIIHGTISKPQRDLQMVDNRIFSHSQKQEKLKKELDRINEKSEHGENSETNTVRNQGQDMNTYKQFKQIKEIEIDIKEQKETPQKKSIPEKNSSKQIDMGLLQGGKTTSQVQLQYSSLQGGQTSLDRQQGGHTSLNRQQTEQRNEILNQNERSELVGLVSQLTENNVQINDQRTLNEIKQDEVGNQFTSVKKTSRQINDVTLSRQQDNQRLMQQGKKETGESTLNLEQRTQNFTSLGEKGKPQENSQLSQPNQSGDQSQDWQGAQGNELRQNEGIESKDVSNKKDSLRNSSIYDQETSLKVNELQKNYGSNEKCQSNVALEGEIQGNRDVNQGVPLQSQTSVNQLYSNRPSQQRVNDQSGTSQQEIQRVVMTQENSQGNMMNLNSNKLEEENRDQVRRGESRREGLTSEQSNQKTISSNVDQTREAVDRPINLRGDSERKLIFKIEGTNPQSSDNKITEKNGQLIQRMTQEGNLDPSRGEQSVHQEIINPSGQDIQQKTKLDTNIGSIQNKMDYKLVSGEWLQGENNKVGSDYQTQGRSGLQQNLKITENPQGKQGIQQDVRESDSQDQIGWQRNFKKIQESQEKQGSQQNVINTEKSQSQLGMQEIPVLRNETQGQIDLSQDTRNRGTDSFTQVGLANSLNQNEASRNQRSQQSHQNRESSSQINQGEQQDFLKKSDSQSTLGFQKDRLGSQNRIGFQQDQQSQTESLNRSRLSQETITQGLQTQDRQLTQNDNSNQASLQQEGHRMGQENLTNDSQSQGVVALKQEGTNLGDFSRVRGLENSQRELMDTRGYIGQKKVQLGTDYLSSGRTLLQQQVVNRDLSTDGGVRIQEGRINNQSSALTGLGTHQPYLNTDTSPQGGVQLNEQKFTIENSSKRDEVPKDLGERSESRNREGGSKAIFGSTEYQGSSRLSQENINRDRQETLGLRQETNPNRDSELTNKKGSLKFKISSESQFQGREGVQEVFNTRENHQSNQGLRQDLRKNSDSHFQQGRVSEPTRAENEGLVSQKQDSINNKGFLGQQNSQKEIVNREENKGLFGLQQDFVNRKETTGRIGLQQEIIQKDDSLVERLESNQSTSNRDFDTKGRVGSQQRIFPQNSKDQSSIGQSPNNREIMSFKGKLGLANDVKERADHESHDHLVQSRYGLHYNIHHRDSPSKGGQVNQQRNFSQDLLSQKRTELREYSQENEDSSMRRGMPNEQRDQQDFQRGQSVEQEDVSTNQISSPRYRQPQGIILRDHETQGRLQISESGVNTTQLNEGQMEAMNRNFSKDHKTQERYDQEEEITNRPQDARLVFNQDFNKADRVQDDFGSKQDIKNDQYSKDRIGLQQNNQNDQQSLGRVGLHQNNQNDSQIQVGPWTQNEIINRVTQLDERLGSQERNILRESESRMTIGFENKIVGDKSSMKSGQQSELNKKRESSRGVRYKLSDANTDHQNQLGQGTPHVSLSDHLMQGTRESEYANPNTDKGTKEPSHEEVNSDFLTEERQGWKQTQSDLLAKERVGNYDVNRNQQIQYRQGHLDGDRDIVYQEREGNKYVNRYILTHDGQVSQYNNRDLQSQDRRGLQYLQDSQSQERQGLSEANWSSLTQNRSGLQEANENLNTLTQEKPVSYLEGNHKTDSHSQTRLRHETTNTTDPEGKEKNLQETPNRENPNQERLGLQQEINNEGLWSHGQEVLYKNNRNTEDSQNRTDLQRNFIYLNDLQSVNGIQQENSKQDLPNHSRQEATSKIINDSSQGRVGVQYDSSGVLLPQLTSEPLQERVNQNSSAQNSQGVTKYLNYMSTVQERVGTQQLDSTNNQQSLRKIVLSSTNTNNYQQNKEELGGMEDVNRDSQYQIQQGLTEGNMMRENSDGRFGLQKDSRDFSDQKIGLRNQQINWDLQKKERTGQQKKAYDRSDSQQRRVIQLDNSEDPQSKGKPMMSHAEIHQISQRNISTSQRNQNKAFESRETNPSRKLSPMTPEGSHTTKPGFPSVSQVGGQVEIHTNLVSNDTTLISSIQNQRSPHQEFQNQRREGEVDNDRSDGQEQLNERGFRGEDWERQRMLQQQLSGQINKDDQRSEDRQSPANWNQPGQNSQFQQNLRGWNQQALTTKLKESQRRQEEFDQRFNSHDVSGERNQERKGYNDQQGQRYLNQDVDGSLNTVPQGSMNTIPQGSPNTQLQGYQIPEAQGFLNQQAHGFVQPQPNGSLNSQLQGSLNRKAEDSINNYAHLSLNLLSQDTQNTVSQDFMNQGPQGFLNQKMQGQRYQQGLSYSNKEGQAHQDQVRQGSDQQKGQRLQDQQEGQRLQDQQEVQRLQNQQEGQGLQYQQEGQRFQDQQSQTTWDRNTQNLEDYQSQGNYGQGGSRALIQHGTRKQYQDINQWNDEQRSRQIYHYQESQRQHDHQADKIELGWNSTNQTQQQQRVDHQWIQQQNHQQSQGLYQGETQKSQDEKWKKFGEQQPSEQNHQYSIKSGEERTLRIRDLEGRTEDSGRNLFHSSAQKTKESLTGGQKMQVHQRGGSQKMHQNNLLPRGQFSRITEEDLGVSGMNSSCLDVSYKTQDKTGFSEKNFINDLNTHESNYLSTNEKRALQEKVGFPQEGRSFQIERTHFSNVKETERHWNLNKNVDQSKKLTQSIKASQLQTQQNETNQRDFLNQRNVVHQRTLSGLDINIKTNLSQTWDLDKSPRLSEVTKVQIENPVNIGRNYIDSQLSRQLHKISEGQSGQNSPQKNEQSHQYGQLNNETQRKIEGQNYALRNDQTGQAIQTRSSGNKFEQNQSMSREVSNSRRIVHGEAEVVSVTVVGLKQNEHRGSSQNKIAQKEGQNYQRFEETQQRRVDSSALYQTDGIISNQRTSSLNQKVNINQEASNNQQKPDRMTSFHTRNVSQQNFVSEETSQEQLQMKKSSQTFTSGANQSGSRVVQRDLKSGKQVRISRKIDLNNPNYETNAHKTEKRDSLGKQLFQNEFQGSQFQVRESEQGVQRETEQRRIHYSGNNFTGSQRDVNKAQVGLERIYSQRHIQNQSTEWTQNQEARNVAQELTVLNQQTSVMHSQSKGLLTLSNLQETQKVQENVQYFNTLRNSHGQEIFASEAHSKRMQKTFTQNDRSSSSNTKDQKLKIDREEMKARLNYEGFLVDEKEIESREAYQNKFKKQQKIQADQVFYQMSVPQQDYKSLVNTQIRYSGQEIDQEIHDQRLQNLEAKYQKFNPVDFMYSTDPQQNKETQFTSKVGIESQPREEQRKSDSLRASSLFKTDFRKEENHGYILNKLMKLKEKIQIRQVKAKDQGVKDQLQNLVSVISKLKNLLKEYQISKRSSTLLKIEELLEELVFHLNDNMENLSQTETIPQIHHHHHHHHHHYHQSVHSQSQDQMKSTLNFKPENELIFSRKDSHDEKLNFSLSQQFYRNSFKLKQKSLNQKVRAKQNPKIYEENSDDEGRMSDSSEMGKERDVLSPLKQVTKKVVRTKDRQSHFQ